ncbi:MAG: hypothetical protein HZB99_01275 [Candidatus Harrisonbacteria bacterium]|nr:hypothetical protein [Candidatus Harrisonbacteria bacterium]
MKTSITSGQEKQYKRFVEDAAEKARKEAGLDKDGLQQLIGKGGEFQADIVASIKKLSAKLQSEPEKVRQFQVEHLLARGYAFDEKDISLPDEAKLKLGLALLVDYETPIDRQCQLLGIKNYLDLSYHEDLHPKPQGRWGWIYGVENGKKMLNWSPNSAIEEFGRNNRRGLMTVKGLALYRENPDLLKDHYVDLSGSRCGRFGDSVPGLYLRDGVPSLDGRWAGVRLPGWGSASEAVV